MVQVKDLTEVTVRDLWREVNDEEDWWGDLKTATPQGCRLKSQALSDVAGQRVVDDD